MSTPLAVGMCSRLVGVSRSTIVRLTLFLLGAGGFNPVLAQKSVVVHDGPTCKTCKITLVKVASLGGKTDEEGLIGRNAMFARDSRGRFFVAPTGVPGQVKVFAPDGRGASSFGKRGQGPGEFGEIRRLWVGPGDSIHVFDSGRHAVFSPDLVYARAHPNPGFPWDAIFLGSGESLQQVSSGARAAVGYPLHVVSASGDFQRSFGSVDRVVERDNPYGRYYSVSASSGGRVWLTKHNAYALELWDTSGTLVQRLIRDAEWFKPWTGRKRNGPIVFSLREDEQGRVWSLIETMAGRSLVEVIDPRTASVIASQELPFFTMRMVGDLVANLREMPDGTPILEVYRLVLTQ